MSRVTEAFRRSRGDHANSSPSAAHSAGRSDWDSCVRTEVPWNLGDAHAATSADLAATVATSPIIASRIRALDNLHGVGDEELNALVQLLLQADVEGRRIRSVMFSTAGSPGGSAELCAAVADALARQTPRSVCLVDGDLRSPSLHALLGVSGSPGLSDLLLNACGPEACLIPVQPNLLLLPAGSRCDDALQILNAQQVRPVLGEVLGRFDHVVLNAPPAGVHGDTNVLGRLVDGAVIVVEANVTRREVARRTIEHMQAAHVRVLGAVLTNRTFAIPETIYRKL